MKAIQGWMCGVDFTFELGEANGGNVVYPSIENLLENKKCAASKYCAPEEVYVLSRNDLAELIQKAGIEYHEFRIGNWGSRTFEEATILK